MFKFLRSKKNYPNCNLCIWDDDKNCSAQGGRTTRERYITKDCFKLYQTEETRKYKFIRENDKK
jgi:zona occludens toxin (predicted ATPase)